MSRRTSVPKNIPPIPYIASPVTHTKLLRLRRSAIFPVQSGL